MTDPLLAFDKLVGNGVQRLVRSHTHDACGESGGARPRSVGRRCLGGRRTQAAAGCELEILIDGAEALPRLADLTSYAGDRFDTSAHPARGGSQVTIFVGRFTG